LLYHSSEHGSNVCKNSGGCPHTKRVRPSDSTAQIPKKVSHVIDVKELPRPNHPLKRHTKKQDELHISKDMPLICVHKACCKKLPDVKLLDNFISVLSLEDRHNIETKLSFVLSIAVLFFLINPHHPVDEIVGDNQKEGHVGDIKVGKVALYQVSEVVLGCCLEADLLFVLMINREEGLCQGRGFEVDLSRFGWICICWDVDHEIIRLGGVHY
jgi:hypothetical protein